MKQQLNKEEFYLEDRIANYTRIEKAMKSQELFNQLQGNYKLIPFYAIFLRILKNKAKRRTNDIELLSRVNEQVINMFAILESKHNYYLGINSLDSKIASLKGVNEIVGKNSSKILSINDKYRFLLLKKFEVYEY